MNKPKTPRRSRLIRKWDGTPIVEEQSPMETLATIPSDSDGKQNPTTLTFDFDCEDELTDTLER